MGVPYILSEQGIEQILDLALDAVEMALFQESAKIVRSDIDRIPR